ADLGLYRVENLVDLLLIRLGVRDDLFARQGGTRRFFSGGVADHAGEVADEKDDAMTELLEVLHLADDDRMAEVDVGGGRIEADLDGERLTALQLGLQIVSLDEVDRAF